MLNFVPKAFTGEETTCPVCVARVQLEAALQNEAHASAQLSRKIISAGGLSEGTANACVAACNLFQSLQADYRVSFAINMAIWFSAERFGRAKKVPDLLLAYEEYRDQSVKSFEAYSQGYEAFASALASEPVASAMQEELKALANSHAALLPSVQLFWQEVNKWTDKRRDDAFRVL